MDAAQNEARKSLQEIEDAACRAKRMAAYAGADITLIAWGVVWFLGYLGVEIIPRLVLSGAPRLAPAIGWMISTWWTLLVIAGIAFTFIAFKRYNVVESATGKRIGIMWGVLFAYAYIAGFLVMPFVELHGFEEQMRFVKHLGAVSAILPMFAYVIMGLWLDAYLAWVGAAVTVLTIIGLVLLYPWFWIWMAVVCGGTLIGTGLFIRRKWRSA